jgi:hypothetical protein
VAKKENTSALAKEWLLLLAGLAGIAYQLITDNVNIALLIAFMGMSGIPGFAHLLSLFRNSPIVLQSSAHQPELQESDSVKSSGNSLEDKR